MTGVETVRRRLRDLTACLEANQSALVNYGARRRRGEPISTGFAESAVNEIISCRMIKKQQMRWSRWTVQPFLDLRTAVLNGTLEGAFGRLYPSFRPLNRTMETAAAACVPKTLHVLPPHLYHRLELDHRGRTAMYPPASDSYEGHLPQAA
jgi:hypothetical protein